MLRTEMIDNLLDSYTKRELISLAINLGINHVSHEDKESFVIAIKDQISNELFDPGGWHEEFNKLAEMEQ